MVQTGAHSSCLHIQKTTVNAREPDAHFINHRSSEWSNARQKLTKQNCNSSLVPGLPQLDCPLSDTTLLRIPRRHEPTLVRVRARLWDCGGAPTDTLCETTFPLPPEPRLMTGTASAAEFTSDRSLLPTLINLCSTKTCKIVDKSKARIQNALGYQFWTARIGLTWPFGHPQLKNVFKLAP